MYLIYNRGKVRTKKLGNVSYHECQNCGNVGIWDLRLLTQSFTMFFIPIHTYKKIRHIACPHCDSYIELTKSKFNEIHKELPNYKSNIINDLFWKSVRAIIILGLIFIIYDTYMYDSSSDYSNDSYYEEYDNYEEDYDYSY